MSQAEELLNSLTETTDDAVLLDGNIVIDSERFITVPESLKKIGVQYDHNIITATFDCPRYWDGRDLATMRFYVNYMRPDAIAGSYLADKPTIDPENPDILHFDWVISGNVTAIQGQISFLVCAKCTDEDGNEKNHWNSEINQELYVTAGMRCQETIIHRYPDIITQLLVRMETAEITLKTWMEETDKELAEWKSATETELDKWQTDTYAELDERMDEAESNTTPDAIRDRVNECLATEETTQQTIYDSVTNHLQNSENFAAEVENRVEIFLKEKPEVVPTDDTLSVDGAPAEAAAVGEALAGKQAKITASGMLKGDGSGGVSAAVAGTDYVVPSGSITGNAATATKAGKADQLTTPRTIRTNLASTATASFDGTGNVTPGVEGVLPVASGGSGKSSWTANRLVYPSAATTMTQLAFPTVAGSVLRQGTSGAPYWTSAADFKTALGAFFSYGASAPSNTSLLWIDTNATTGGLKYYNGSAWVHVPVAYT